ncbi:MAG: outer membrane beta-barrel protein [Acidobacteria bacterium]|nr:outer membrane beta-barrel protein [Acidobacteriota bacterium]
MIGKRWFGPIAVLGALALAVPCALAEETSWYVGGSAGPASTGLGVSNFDDGSLTAGSVDDSGTGWKIFGGYQFAKHFGVEGGFVDLDKTSFDGTSDGTGSLYSAGTVTSTSEANGLFAAAVGILPVVKNFSVFGKAGLMNWDGDTTLSDSSGTLAGSDDGSDPMFGVGVEFRRGTMVSLRAEWEQFSDILGTDVDLISGNILFRF